MTPETPENTPRVRPLDLPGPLVVGGVGGSGTRVIALMLQQMGFYIGAYLNRADDNMWFDTLFNRPNWLRSAGGGELTRALTLFDRAMHDERPGLDPATVWRVWSAALDKRHLVLTSGQESSPRRWIGGTYHRAASLLRLTRPIDRAAYRAWGWKYPISHLYLDALADFYPDMKFIMVIRHGLDMAFSDNSGQLRVWSWVYGMQPDALSPANQLAFWVKANQKAIETGKAWLGARFLALNFDALCRSPASGVEQLIDFIGLDVSEEMQQKLAAIPHVPASMGRYREHDLGQFDPADVEAVRQLGFEVEGR